MAIISLVAIAAIAAAIYFWRGQQAATARLQAAQADANHTQQTFKAGKTAIDAVVSDLANGFGKSATLQASQQIAIMAGVERAMDALVSRAGNDPEVQRSQASMYVQFSTTYLGLGDTKLAVDSARKGLAIFRALAAAQPDDDDMQSNVGLSQEKLAEALRASGDAKGALAADRESLEVARALAAKNPGNRQFRTDVVLALWRLAEAGDQPRERLTEALKILKDLKLAAMLTPDQEKWIAMIEDELARMQ